MKLPLRADLPPSLKSSLSLFFNETITNLWMQSPFRQNILLGNDNSRKKDVTKVITDLANSVLNTGSQKDKEEGWTTVGSNNRLIRPPSALLTDDNFVIPTQNRYKNFGN